VWPARVWRPILHWLGARAENIAVVMLAALFLTFILQIVSRYVLNSPIGWTLELCLTLWIWIVFWGAAFCVRDKDHVTFDILYLSAGHRPRRVFAFVSAVAIVVGLLASLPATWDYITFYEIKKSATLKIRLDYVFSVYAIFAVAVIARYTFRLVALFRKGDPPEAGTR
jgi:TRAP-type C4-dicarboxylate transport system permease small subunit